MIDIAEGDSADDVWPICHRCDTSPPTWEFRLRIHRGDQAIDTTSPPISLTAWNALRDLVDTSGSDSAMDSWASGIGGTFAVWWANNVAPSSPRWHAQIRAFVEVAALCP